MKSTRILIVLTALWIAFWAALICAVAWFRGSAS